MEGFGSLHFGLLLVLILLNVSQSDGIPLPLISQYNFRYACVCTQSCLSLCNPVDYSSPGFSVLHYLLEFVQIHAHWIGDAIQPSHPCRSLLILPSVLPGISESFPMSQLFISGSQSIGASALATVLPMNIEGWFPLLFTGIFSSTTISKYHFFSAQPSLWFNSCIHTWLLEKP